MAKLIPPVVPAGAMSGSDQPEILVDEDLWLRPWHPGDAATVVEAFSTPDIQRYHFRHFATESDAQHWIEDCAEGWRSERSASWAIVERDDNRVVGRVTVYTSLEDGYGEVSYWVLPSSRGRGVATRACVAATRWSHELGLHRIQLEHSIHNEGSRRVALKAGFVKEGIRRGANLHADGWHDMVLYSHLATDDD
ncbi:MAG: GNAT family N-acetyltransferase [Acidimicrobiales bacterium]